ncbi:MAG: NDP-sugar synthase [Deltaproteobacteria bacterium]|nr:NDP-sugar synthase [Myxococcales bacterium]MDP3218886.1 NDP-sugar synthase [Deltaproteobacteria bacterium]
MDALLLCAGLGTRLRPLTDERPKPLVPVLDRPLAAFALDHLAAAGARRVVANAFHLAEQIEPALAPLCAALGLSLTVLREATLLGTGGAIRHALPHLDDHFVVFNGDVLARPDLAGALATHRALGARVTMVLREDPRATALGAIELDAGGRVRRILDEGPGAEVATRRCVFTGVYVVSRSVADDLPVEGCVVRHTLRRLLARGEVVAGVLDGGPWFDLGTLDQYAAVNFALATGALRWPGVTAPGDGIVAPPGLARAGFTSPLIIGSGAVVSPGATLARAIVWDGAAVGASVRDAVVTRRAVVPLPASVGAS